MKTPLQLITYLNNISGNMYIHFFLWDPILLEMVSSAIIRRLPFGGTRNVNLQLMNVKGSRGLILGVHSCKLHSYKHVRSSCLKTLKKQKRRGWREFCTQFDFKTPTSEIWSLIKVFKKKEDVHCYVCC